MNPKYPIYIVSKGRAETRLTSKALEAMNIPYSVVIEEQEYDIYAAAIDPRKLIILDPKYKENYDTFDDLGLTKSVGPGAARNFAWDHSIERGAEWHWVMDDNIDGFYRLNYNLKTPMSSGSGFRAMEDFSTRYSSVGMAGPNYFMFASRKTKMPPYVLNTRIYSCNLIRNDVPYRWRGRYNEDTDLSIRMMRDDWVTIQFNAFLQLKVTNQTLKGGNTEEFYKTEGTLPKSEMQVAMHPDISKLVWRFGRWHHYVDYSSFKRNKLIPKPGLEIPDGVDNYGMELQERNGSGWKPLVIPGAGEIPSPHEIPPDEPIESPYDDTRSEELDTIPEPEAPRLDDYIPFQERHEIPGEKSSGNPSTPSLFDDYEPITEAPF